MSNSRDIADSAATINFIDGLTSDAQTQIDSKDSFPSQTGNADKYLTTDGTNASWGELQTQTTVTAIASGTLANGAAVQLNSDGTVSSPSLSYISSPTYQQVSSQSGQQSSCCFDHVNNKIYVFWWSGTYWDVAVGIVNISDKSISFTLEQNISGMNQTSSQDSCCVYNETLNAVVFCWNSTSTQAKARLFYSDSSNNITYGNIKTLTTGGTVVQPKYLAYDPNSTNVILFYNNYPQSYFSCCVLSATGGVITQNTSLVINQFSNQDYGQSVYIPSIGKHVVMSSNENASSTTFDAAVITVSGTSVSKGTNLNLTTIFSNSGRASISYNSDVDRVVCIARRDAGGDKPYATVLTVTGTTLTSSAVDNAVPLNTNASNSPLMTYYDNTSNKSYTVIDGNSYEMTVTTTSAVLTSTDGTTLGTPYFDVVQFPSSNAARNYFFSNITKTYFNTKDLGLTSFAVFTANTSLNANAVLGVSSAAYTNGQSATILAVSATATVTGVAASVKYYAQFDGTLGTYNSGAYLGIGTATDTLLVKG